MRNRATIPAMAAALWMAASVPAAAQVVYSNDFETDTNGFGFDGTLADWTAARVSLPTDSGGLASPNQSMWLGKLGDGIAKLADTDEIVTVALADLEPFREYFVSFDLLIGASWDGAANGYGPDSWRFSVNGVRLVDTMFSNGEQGVNVGAYSPQRYTDTSYTSPNGPDVPRFTGADASFSLNQGGNYASDYAIYWFGHGDGNPVLHFTTIDGIALLEWARYGSTESSDEYWALDNVAVTAPEPDGAALAALALVASLAARRRR
jgi:MYXO-CTERM domain-containing protein